MRKIITEKEKERWDNPFSQKGQFLFHFNLKRYKHPMFIAALFTITKAWKESKSPSTDEWIKKTVYIGQYIQWTIIQPKK